MDASGYQTCERGAVRRVCAEKQKEIYQKRGADAATSENKGSQAWRCQDMRNLSRVEGWYSLGNRGTGAERAPDDRKGARARSRKWTNPYF